MMRDTNKIAGLKSIPIITLSFAMTLGYIGTALCLILDNFVQLPMDSLTWIELVGNLLLWVTFGSLALSMALIYRDLRRLKGQLFGFWSGLFAVLGILLGFIFLPYAQYLLNQIVTKPSSQDS